MCLPLVLSIKKYSDRFLSQTFNILSYYTFKFPNIYSVNAEIMFCNYPNEIRATSEDLCEFKPVP